MGILSLIEKNIQDVEYDKAEDYIRIVADFFRKSRKIFISNYSPNINEFLKKLITYIEDDILGTYETLVDVF